jgi:hypothetical protein
LNEKKLDINGIFAYPAHAINVNQKKVCFNYNGFDLYSKNPKQIQYFISDISNELIQKYVHYDKDDTSLVNVDYLCGGSCFRKSTLCKLFNNPIPTIETGEDIIFCLTSKKQGIPVYCFAPETDELLIADDNDISSTCTIPVFKKRSELIKNYWVNK